MAAYRLLKGSLAGLREQMNASVRKIQHQLVAVAKSGRVFAHAAHPTSVAEVNMFRRLGCRYLQDADYESLALKFDRLIEVAFEGPLSYGKVVEKQHVPPNYVDVLNATPLNEALHILLGVAHSLRDSFRSSQGPNPGVPAVPAPKRPGPETDIERHKKITKVLKGIPNWTKRLADVRAALRGEGIAPPKQNDKSPYSSWHDRALKDENLKKILQYSERKASI